jgi:hypothetical protein
VGSRSRQRSRPADAAAVRTARRSARWERRRAGLRRHIVGIRADDAVVFGAITVASVWGWIALTLGAPGDVGGGPVVVAAAVCLGTLVLLARRWHQRRRAAATRMPLLALPVVTTPLILLAITPPEASTEGFLPGVGVGGVILATALLSIAGLLTAFVAAVVLVWPVLLLADAVRPPVAGAAGASGMARSLTRRELGGAGVLVSTLVGWAVAMTAVLPTSGSGSTRGRMVETLVVWATLRGEPVPSFVALALLLVAVGVIVGMGRAQVPATAR